MAELNIPVPDPSLLTTVQLMRELWTLLETDEGAITVTEQKPTVGRNVHYVSYGTPGGEYPSTCRAAIVTAISHADDDNLVDLCVLNPEGMFFNRKVELDDGGETIGDLECPDREYHGNPHRYCGCG